MIKNYLSLVFLVFCISISFGQTTLSAGEVVITGFNSVNPDQFSFVLLTDVTNTTEIKFTDNGWFAGGGFRNNEGTLIWTATSDLPCGTEIIVDDQSPFTCSVGSITDSAGFGLAANGDQIFAYQGPDATPTFLYGVNFDALGWAPDAVNANTSALPATLTNAVNAIHLNEIDNAKYDCSVTSVPSLILAAVSTDTNWNIRNTTPFVLGGCTYTCGQCTSDTTWNGTAWDNGLPNMNTAAIIDGNYNTNTDGSFSTCILVVNSGAVLNVQDNTFIEVDSNIIADGEINVATAGSVVQIDDLSTVSGSGVMRVTKTTAIMDTAFEYTYWSSPTASTTIDNGLTEGNPIRRFYFDATNYLDATAETNNDNTPVDGQDDIDDNGDDWTLANGTDMMIPGVGYASTHRPDIFNFPGVGYDYTFEGPFNNGVITVPVYRNNSELDDNNWNFIGNPYPSAVDITPFFNLNSTAANPATGAILGDIHFWSHDTDANANNNGNEILNFTRADYATINSTGATSGNASNPPDPYIPSGQGFFVAMSDAANPISTTGDISESEVVFNNSMRSTGPNDQFFRNNTEHNKLWLNLTSDNGVTSQILVGYVPGATAQFDGNTYDSPRNMATGVFASISSMIPNTEKDFVIQGKATSDLSLDEIIDLGFNTSIDVPTIYTIAIQQVEGDFMNTQPIFLKDNLLNTIHNLKESDYSFTSESGVFNDRFQIFFNAEVLSNDDVTLDNNQLTITELANGDVQFSINANLNITNIQIVDLLGRTVYNLDGNDTTMVYNLDNLKKSAYIARVTLSNGQTITKKAIKRQ
ncbi:T9SS type A sorting domain-containing protein [Winogradskyella alexanderae]|uniref:T9SS type A sorting domain-containing protein n=1 Tax=Winogradskyella alexanderae TaxID=2877123 RepID=A0ABS7XN50_9FLAO|nr:T9SS type A sorting domain-containing protein [Winogradskyella alexanderae]MCA0131432.1 hypothetical protein [Winogradskyella alexanderae]